MVKVRVNTDAEIVAEIRKRLKENDGYCPCKLVHTDDTKCMCKEFRDTIDIGEPAECHCGLFQIVKEE